MSKSEEAVDADEVWTEAVCSISGRWNSGSSKSPWVSALAFKSPMESKPELSTLSILDSTLIVSTKLAIGLLWKI